MACDERREYLRAAVNSGSEGLDGRLANIPVRVFVQQMQGRPHNLVFRRAALAFLAAIAGEGMEGSGSDVRNRVLEVGNQFGQRGFIEEVVQDVTALCPYDGIRVSETTPDGGSCIRPGREERTERLPDAMGHRQVGD